MDLLVRKFAEEVVGPKVEAMDEAEKMDPSVIKALFDQGVSRSPRPPPTPSRIDGQPDWPTQKLTRFIL